MKWKILKYVAIFIVSLGIVGGIGASLLVNKYYKELPNVSELVENYSPPIPTTIYDRNGQVIDVISKETREPVGIEHIPQNLQNAFIAIEDRQFLTHYGIDPFRILGSAIVNLKSGRAAQGGSTITQQLARNAFLSHEKKFSRKIKEIIITFEIERKYTKDEIMEKYLNEIYFGSGAYGVKTAAHNFFRKDVNDVNLAESALLAGIPNRPNMYNPRTNLEKSLVRQKLILKQMEKFGLITEAEYNEALNHKFVNESKASSKDFKDKNTTIIYDALDKKIEFNAPDFTDLVQKFLFENFEEKQIYNDGLLVETTLDLNIQKVAKDKFENYPRLKNDKKLQGAMVTIDAKNGEVISIIGGKNFKTGNFNRAVQAKRQVGSSFKPFIYYTALEKGFEENLVVEDSRIVFGTWAPRNFGERYYNGMTLMQGFDKSQNIVSIKLLNKVGIPALMDTMKKIDAGFVVPNNLTAALGTTEGTPLQVAQSYAVFANGGYSIKPFYVTKVSDKFGNTLYEAKPQIEQKFESADIALMTNMMKNSVKQGTSRSAQVKINNVPIEQGGKTGTTNNSRTVWYSGMTPDYVTTIYVGYDNNDPLYKATGGGVAAPLWKNFYQEIIEKGYYTPTTFTFLDNHVKNGDLTYQELDPISGLLNGSPSDKTFLLRRGRIAVEKDSKYANGIAGVLGYYVPTQETTSKNEAMSSEEVTGPATQQVTQPVQQQKQQKPQQQKKEEKKGFFQRLFNF
ncbi:transglycosylase domain-containing protein [Cetobacterium somerae]|uniref:transglycosylase domain-containing protein n=1 Tax=Cetobacterium somerae TaxID=188913 RepID=UPI001F052553|nr:transglycosylase domain-containing protein [Cetobacterium somerae]MCX3065932.1 transglycosylase domain-containing protein [Cetobacterium somerae]UPO96397.1 penicillin-binding protein [Cetobacterium somerae]